MSFMRLRNGPSQAIKLNCKQQVRGLCENNRYQIAIIGGGTGGCSIGAKLSSKLGKNKVAIIEPCDVHYYQPMFTLIGGGMKTLRESKKYMKDILPNDAKWIQDSATTFDLENNKIYMRNGNHLVYDVLIIAAGIQPNFQKIPGLQEALLISGGNVSSIYSPKYVNKVYDNFKKFRNGNAVFTYPQSAVKCPGAPQKIMYIFEHFLRKKNLRQNSQIMYNSALPVIFGVKYFADSLWKIVKERNIEVNLNSNLIEVKPERNEAVFANINDINQKTTIEYSFLHAVPPQNPPDSIRLCTELVNDAGYVDVDKDTLQHTRYQNVFAIGDCSSSPNSKTMAAIAAQLPVIAENVVSVLHGKKLMKHYDGYSSCPLVTGYNSCIMAEFDYTLEPKETFPFRQDVERLSMFLAKKEFMPPLYWHLMLKGYWNGPAFIRNMLSVFK